MLRVVFRIQHPDKAFDGCGLVAAVIVERSDIGNDIRHLVNRVVSAFRSGAVAADAVDIDADFHSSSVASVDAAVRRFCRNDEFRTNAGLVDNVLPAKAVTVFLHDGSDNHDTVAFRYKIQILHDLCAVDSRRHAAFLIGASAPVDHILILIALVRIVRPVIDIADSDGIDMGINRDNLLPVAHPADHVAETVDFHLIKGQLFHLLLNAGDDFAFFAAFRRV